MSGGDYPRALSTKELELLEYVLPAERADYRRYRELLAELVVIGEGRRGPGNVILGVPGAEPDLLSPLPGVVAYGMVETTLDAFTVTVREERGGQVDVEIVSRRGDVLPPHFEEKRRWTYSLWEPGLPSPDTGAPVQEVRIDPRTVLALASGERRIWVWEETGGAVRPVPITNFFNALMQVKRIRDPAMALRSDLLFERPGAATETDLRRAFVLYNSRHPKVRLTPAPAAERPARLRSVLARWFRKTD